MQLEQQDVKAIATRLKRAHGHLGTVIRMLEEGSDCEDVLTQLSAVNKAISRSGFALVATGMEYCLAHPDDEGVDRKKLEKLFLSLA